MDNQDYCSICHRSSTEVYDVELRPLRQGDSFDNRIIRRSFGDKNGMVEGCLVCIPCSNFVCPRNRKDRVGSWKFAWPAIVWNCLSVVDYAPVIPFLQFLPPSMRNFWTHCMDLWTPAMRDGVNQDHHFRDITQDVKQFQDVVRSGRLGRLMALLNANPYPDVRCPQGCCMYIDDYLRGKLDKTPANHYLTIICPKMMSFGADGRFLKGARSDWTTPFVDLEWIVRPCLIVTEEEGLCFVHCHKTRHSTSQHQWIHVPTNPVLGNRAQPGPDIQAPVVLAPNCVREGRSNAHNTSFPVLEQVGSTSGLSTFQLSLKYPPIKMDDRAALCMGLVYNNRPDILYIAKQSANLAPRILDILQHFTDHPSKPSTQTQTHHRSCGSYVEAEEAQFIADSFNQRLTIREAGDVGDEDGQHHVNCQPKDCSILIHPADDSGLPPLLVDLRQYELRPNNIGQLAYSLLMVVFHSRHLFQAFLHMKWRDVVPDVARLQHLIVRTLRNIQYRKSLLLSVADIHLLRNLVGNERVGQQREERLAIIIRNICNDIHVNSGRAEVDLLRCANDCNQTIFIFTRPHTQWEAPEVLLQGKWILMLGLSAAEALFMTFRWSASVNWQHAGTLAHENAPGQHLLLLYVRDSRIKAVHRSILNLCCGQDIFRCIVHDELLIRASVGNSLQCCYPYCNCKLQWRCAVGLRDEQCTVGICRKHFLIVMKDNPYEPIFVGNYELNVNGRRLMENMLPPQENNDDDTVEVADILDDRLAHIMDELNDDVTFDFNNNNFMEDDMDCRIPMTTTVVHQPMYKAESSSATASHFYLNSHLRVMARSQIMRKPPIAVLQMLQSICSKSPDWSVPLVYPEAMLFPRIFWSMIGNSVVGAMPSVMYSNISSIGGGVSSKQTASLIDHLLARLTDSSLLTSHDQNYIQYAFDILLNSDLNRNSAVIACHRGLEAVIRDGARISPDNQDDILKFDETDARREVNRLVSLLRTEGEWTYFITLTCNDSKTFGVAPLRRSIAQFSQENDIPLHQLLQNYCVLLTRAWERTAHYFWQYLVTSDERPLGHVKAWWMRYEFQSAGALGNRPHVHGGVTLHDECIDETLSRVRCSNMSMWSERCRTDYISLLRDGIVQSEREYGSLMEQASVLQQHSCEMARQRCKKRKLTDDTFICRVPKHPPGFKYWFEHHHQLYDEDVYRKLEYLDLAVKCSCGSHWVNKGPFTAGMWHYPAQIDEHFVPTIPRIFAGLQSSSNVQVCDRKFQVSYLAKYAAGQNEGKQVTLSATKDANEINVEGHDLFNIKITSQRIHAKNQHPQSLAREIALTEMVWYCMRFPFVVSSSDFIHASTKPPEYRAAIVKRYRNGLRRPPVDGGGGLPAPVEHRLGFPQWRQFTESQVSSIKSFESSHFCLDQTSSFSLRPPELLIVSELELYLRWFTWVRDPKSKVNDVLQLSHWMDGANRCVRIRQAHVVDVVNYVHRLINTDLYRHTAYQMFAFILGPVYHEHKFRDENDPLSELYVRFVDCNQKKRNVVVFPSPTPSYVPNFIVHLLLTMGRFVSERDLYQGPTMKEAFSSAGLLPIANVCETDVKNLARRYVTEQLLWLPIGSRTFGRRLNQVIDALKTLFIDQVDAISMPLTLHDDMRESANEQILKTESTLRNTAIDVLQSENIPNFPDVAVLRQGRVDFQPIILRADGQSDASLTEQESALASCINAINARIIQKQTYRSQILVGPPGCGKTHILLIVNTYALSLNCRCALVAVTSERARRLGGEHIHLMFAIPVMEIKFHTVNSVACRALLHLSRSPLRLAILQRIEVLFIEEISLLSAEMLATMDIILRHVKQCDQFLGGILAICTGDPCQLSPVEGTEVWSSHHMISSFDIVTMQYFVRAAQDVDLQELIILLRTINPTNAQIEQFVRIIRRRCIPRNCVKSWEEVPTNVLRIVGTRAACKEIVDEYIQRKKNDPTIEKWISTAYDEAEVGGGTWAKANKTVSNALDKRCLEPGTLFLFKGQILRLTYNHSQATPTLPRFSQGQCCVVQTLPTMDCNKLWVQLVPPGQRNFDGNHLPVDQPGWDLFALEPSPTTTLVVSSGQTKARRNQYRLTYYVCSTVHRSLGETCTRIATQISIKNHKYRLWDKQQLLVVISRVSSLDSILLVTQDDEDTVFAMLKLFQQESPVHHFTVNLINCLSPAGSGIISYALNPTIDLNVSLPVVDRGFVYMLVSTKLRTFAYVGETCNINRRLREHNSCRGAAFTQNRALIPWACFVLVSGFPGHGAEVNNIRRRRLFEMRWHEMNGNDVYPNTRTILLNGRIVFNEFRRQCPMLVWQQFGRL